MADRLGRHRRLAAAQRAGEHRVGGPHGCDSPRRRGRDRAALSHPARRAWRTRRRWPRGEARAGARRDPPRRWARRGTSHVEDSDAQEARPGGGPAGTDGARPGSSDACPRPPIPSAPIPPAPPSTGCGATLPRSGRTPAPGLPAVRLDPRGPRPARVVRRESAARGSRLVDGPGGQPVGLVGRPRPGRRRPRRRHRLAPRLGARRRGVRRSARRGLGASRRSTCCASEGSRPARPIGVVHFVEEEGARFGLACPGSRLPPGADRRTRPAAAATATA